MKTFVCTLYLVLVQFLLRQAFADDEASTRLLQILLFLLLSTASLMFIPCAIRSSLGVLVRHLLNVRLQFCSHRCAI